MLADILATTQHAHKEANQASQALDYFQDLVVVGESRMLQDLRVLNEGDSAQWMAGFMYAYTGQTEDVRDYIVDCSRQISGIDKKLARAYKRYANGNFEGGNIPIVASENAFRRSMRDCDETNDLFEEIVDTAKTFFAQPDYQDIIDANLQAN